MQEIFDEKSVDEKVKSNKLEKNMNGKIKDRVNSQKIEFGGLLTQRKMISAAVICEDMLTIPNSRAQD